MKRVLSLLCLFLGFSSFGSAFAQWGPERVIKSAQDTVLTLAYYYNERTIATDTFGRVHVVWTQFPIDTSGGQPVWLYYMRSTDGGNTWDLPIRLNQPVREISYPPSIAADGLGNVHVVWTDNISGGGCGEIYRRSTDGGQSWEPETMLVFNSNGLIEGQVAASENGVVHLAWSHPGPPNNVEVGYKRSPDGGKTWSPDTFLTNTPFWNQNVSLALDSKGRPHISWNEDRGMLGPILIWYKSSSDGGLTWNPSVMIADSDTTGPAAPNIAIDGLDRVYVFFMAYWGSKPDSTWSGQIVYRVSEDTGGSFGPRQALTVYPYKPGLPCVTGDINGGVHVVWSDTIPGNRYWGLVYNGSTDGGRIWRFNPYFILVDSPGAADPSTTTDSRGKAHVVYWKASQGPPITFYILYRNGYPLGVEERTDKNQKLDQSMGLRISPNPMRAMTKFLVQAPGSIRATLRIYDIAGRLVRDLSSEVFLSSGIVWWDGKDERGRLLPSGVYLSRLEGGGAESKQERLVILR